MTSISLKICIVFSILMLICSITTAEKGNISLNLSDSDAILPQSVNETARLPSESEDNTSLSLVREPRTELVFSTPGEGEKSNQTEDKTSLNTSFTQDSPSEPVTNASEKYLSLGDIIKAQDWNALSEYKCRIQTENPESFDDSDISMSDKQARWDSRFTAPPVVVIPSCCG